VIADNLQKGDKGKILPNASASTIIPQVFSVSPLSKDAVGVPKSKGKIKSKKKKGEILDKKEPVKCPVEEKEEGFTGYAGLARRVAGRIVGEIRGKPKFWFDD
jgi:hypothetical protein